MQNPFTKEQIKNYLLLYGAIVVIMLLFYLLNSLLSEKKQHERKLFETNASVNVQPTVGGSVESQEAGGSGQSRFKLLEKGY